MDNIQIEKKYIEKSELKKKEKENINFFFYFFLLMIKFYGYINYMLRKILRLDPIFQCEMCKFYFYNKGIYRYQNYNLCLECLKKNADLLEYLEDCPENNITLYKLIKKDI